MKALSLRDRLQRHARKYRAVRILTNSLTRHQRDELDELISRLAIEPAHRLRAIEGRLRTRFDTETRHLGVIAGLEKLEAAIAPNREVVVDGTSRYWCMSKWELNQLFTAYGTVLPIYDRLPLHARIGIDAHGFRESIGSMEIFCIEASLFEDMTANWNSALDAKAAAEAPAASPREVKTMQMQARSTVRSAFSLLEGYLNGIAADLLLMSSRSSAETTLLAEWDGAKARPRFLSLRDRLLQYPRIAVGAGHPPIQESSSAAMGRLLEAEKRMRDALIHPRPQIMPASVDSFREAAYFEIDTRTVGAICDDVVAVIKDVSACIGPQFGDVTWWLTARADAGPWPESVFD